MALEHADELSIIGIPRGYAAVVSNQACTWLRALGWWNPCVVEGGSSAACQQLQRSSQSMRPSYGTQNGQFLALQYLGAWYSSGLSSKLCC